MIKIKFFSSFCNSQNCIDVYSRILDIIKIDNYGKKIIFTNNDNEYTHAVILNTAMPKLNCKKENVIGLAFEPPCFLNLTNEFIYYAINNINKYYIGDNKGLPSNFINHHGFMWYIPFPKTIDIKNNLISIVFSNKNKTTGHKYRHLLIKSIIKFNLPIDIWGNGCELLNINDSRIKGKFKDPEPYDRYKFSIAIENVSLPDYISEKYINCLLYETTPIYYGALNVDNYFPDKSIKLSGKLKEDLSLLNDIIKEPNKYIKKINRYEILNKINLIDHLVNIFEK